MAHTGTGTTIVLLAALAATPAFAEDCSLQMVTSMEMAPVPGGDRMLVPVSVNGQTRHLLLGTGGGNTSLTGAAGKALGLHALYSDKLKLLDESGNASTSYFTVGSLKLGDYLQSRNLSLMMTPDPDAGIDPPLDGILAPDLMDHYDVEIDFATRKLIFFSQDHCQGQVVHWPASAVGVVPIEVRKRAEDHQARSGPVVSHTLLAGGGTVGQFTDPAFQTGSPGITGTDIRVRVTLDGKDFTANIDTGAEDSTLNSDDAKAAFDVTAQSPGSSPLGDVSVAPDDKTGASETVTVNGSHAFEHTFHTLAFGGVTVVNPHFTVRPAMMGAKDKYNDLQLGSHIARVDDGLAPDVTIGMNILRELHLFFAFKEDKLYVTAAGAPKI